MYKLFYAPDNASLIIRMLLETLEIDYTAVLVDRAAHMQKSAEYLALNPSGLIPVCVIDDQPVFETAAILLTIADRYPHQKLSPAIDSVERSQFLKWLFYLSNSVHSDLRQLFYPQQYVGDNPIALEQFRSHTSERLTSRLQIVEDECASHDGNFFMQQGMTILDFYLATMLRWAQLYPSKKPLILNLQLYPKLQKLVNEVEQVQGVQCACAQEGISLPLFDQPNYANPMTGTAT
jgi:glutathione S-transferase